jgi:hypothetical protein
VQHVFSGTKGSLGQVSVLSCILSGATGNLTQVSALFCCTAAHVAFISKCSRTCLRDSSKILNAVNACNSSIAKIIPQQGTNKSAEAICATLKQQMINLKEEKELSL